LTVLALALLGSPVIRLDEVERYITPRKALALLAYLAVTGQTHRRDSLATLFWPEADRSRARADLRNALWVLNRSLGEGWLAVERETVALPDRPGLWVDVRRFNELVAMSQAHAHPGDGACPTCAAVLHEAVTLYRDDLLAGFSLNDSEQFDEWQFYESESMRRQLSRALQSLVDLQISSQDWEPAIAHARRLVALDPLHEASHQQLMQLLMWAGQRAAALRQYAACERALACELGEVPALETRQLYEAIREHRLPAPASRVTGLARSPVVERAPLPHPAVPSTTRAGDLPLVGRELEWEALQRAYEAARVHGRLLVLEGEAGIGKSRLAEEFLACARAAGAATITARSYPGETNLAYGPFLDALKVALESPPDAQLLDTLSDEVLAEASRLLPGLRAARPTLPPAPPLDSPGAQSRFLDGISQVLVGLLAGTGAGVLLLDDLQWADEASLDLLTFLARRLDDRPLLLLVTWRSDLVREDHRLRRLLAERLRAGQANVLMLGRLARESVAKMVAAARGNSASGKSLEYLVDRLYSETEGLPFFLIEYLTALGEQAGLAQNAPWELPGGVRDLVSTRIAAVDRTARQVLRTAAAIGRAFSFDLLGQTAGLDEESLISAIEELLSEGLVEATTAGDGPPLYDFSHEKVRAFVYEQTSLPRRRLLHRRIADALEGQLQSQESPALHSQIAYHLRLAGQAGQAATHFRIAGDHARALYANSEALAHYLAALATGDDDDGSLHEATGDLHTLAGHYGAALYAYGLALDLCQRASVPAIQHKVGDVYLRRGEWDLAEQAFQSALDTLAANGREHEGARIYVDWSLASYHQNQPDAALELARKALSLAESGGERRSRAQAHNVLGILARSRGDLDEARAHLEQSLRLVEQGSDPDARVAAMNNLALAYGAAGESDRALGLGRAALALCLTYGDRHRQAALHNNLADLLHASGQTEEAMAHLKISVSIYAEIGVEAGAWQPEIWKLSEW
jgi:predicted ATPase/DNA-binding SARP family transcriptional activator